ncbi:TetR/AcrR family transcriptional regulator [Nocardioides agariphilus]|jgi:AcrR family transcriptional regulator|uniref:TetR/AcrR family transcriptional regulator n=2 Tax=Nocardioides agariphilus TaxID=433664 RepID=A0A930YQY3_9ACTN|nr:TetR/AcrR family transcriptional regulator [Nocardioides agariphilus]
MDMVKVKRESLARADWVDASLQALSRGGLAAVAVEPLAKQLHTTKGSFYWHFADRNDLLEATLQLWEQRETELVIASLDVTADAATRLRSLLRLAFMSVMVNPAHGRGSVELALQSSASEPMVAATLDRVTRRRVAQLTELFTELGLTRSQARDRGLLAYTAFLGHLQLAHATPEMLPRGRAFSAHVNQIVETLVGLRP